MNQPIIRVDLFAQWSQPPDTGGFPPRKMLTSQGVGPLSVEGTYDGKTWFRLEGLPNSVLHVTAMTTIWSGLIDQPGVYGVCADGLSDVRLRSVTELNLPATYAGQTVVVTVNGLDDDCDEPTVVEPFPI